MTSLIKIERNRDKAYIKYYETNDEKDLQEWYEWNEKIMKHLFDEMILQLNKNNNEKKFISKNQKN